MTDDERTRRFFQAIKTLAPGSEPVRLRQHQPEPDAMPNECYTNCQKKVARDGGAMQCGWIFSGCSRADYVVASGHAVWRSPEGTLIDITPMLPMDNRPNTALLPLRDTEGNLTFLPDANAFEPNRFLPLTKNKTLIRACHRLNRREWQVRHDPKAMEKRCEQLRTMRDQERNDHEPRT